MVSLSDILLEQWREIRALTGQLINLLFCHRLPIPRSWQLAWAAAM